MFTLFAQKIATKPMQIVNCSEKPSTIICSAGENAKLEKEAEWGMVVCADDPELLDKLDQAVEKGELGDVKNIIILILVPSAVQFLSYSVLFQP